MAAKPPAKPPGNFLKQINECINSGNNKTAKIFNKLSSHLKKNETDNNSNSGSSFSGSNNSLSSNSNTHEDTAALLTVKATSTTPAAEGAAAAKKSTNCNCTNISIMHLFHEMKQEFPTIPDTIVAKYVNENCHQRENCMQQLQHELTLHAIPLQTYPGKVLHPTATLQHKRTPSGNTAELSTPTAVATPPLRPIRPAPIQPSFKLQQQKQSCDSFNNNINNNSNTCLKSAKSPGFMRKDVNFYKRAPTSDMPATSLISPSSFSNSIANNNSNNNNHNHNNNNISATNSSDNAENVNPNGTPNAVPTAITPRTRPTTLNLQQQQKQNQQQQQRLQINQQLQKHFQQRQQLLNEEQQQQQQEQQTKPLRRAPLPPLPPKPAHYVNAGAHSPQLHHQNNSSSSNSNSNGNHNLVNSQRSSFSNDSSLTSPSSSVGESEISVNVSLSSPIVSTSPASAAQQQQTAVNAALRSPIRHRSVITVHPEPPYTRDFVNASSSSPTTPSGGGGTSGGPKSFTSVNLTLRQPNANSAVPASTIDISAGPGLSGIGGGLTYSSTSYDARFGYQKNFHITVTNEGGVFSASRIRPRSCFVPEADHAHDGPGSPTTGSQVNSLRTASSEQCVSAQLNQQPQEQRVQQQNTLAASNNAGEICRPKENNAVIEILARQKFRRDKLATALRDNKKRLGQVEKEINVLTEPIREGENERLDEEIRKLRCDCEALLNEIDVSRRSGPSLMNVYNRQLPHAASTQPQPFPRQRSLRTPTPTTTNIPTLTQRQPNLDFIQHHNTPRTPATHHPQQQAPPTYQEYCQQYYQRNQQQQQPQQRFINSTDEEEYSDSVTDADDDDDYEEESLEMWACNMCTFRNHPQLNICECCENVRILPGTLRQINVAAASSIQTTATSTNSNAAENDANLTPQQLQHFALPT